MSKTRPLGALSALALLLNLVAAGGALAQAAPPNSQDPFAGIHARLLTAADQTLATALADRLWMKPEGSPATPTKQAASLRVERVQTAIERVRQLRPVIEPILREEGVPLGIIAVILVESGGQPMALSPKGARGIWQFMPDTARRYGLNVNSATDERLDVAKATRAAARYLRDLYGQFGDWELAFAAYNAGQRAVEVALVRGGVADFYTAQRYLPQETRRYVPAVFAAIQSFGGGGDPPLGKTVPSSAGRLLYASEQAELVASPKVR